MEELLPWSKERDTTLGPVIPHEELLDVLQPLWIYRGMESTVMKVQIATDLIIHRTSVKTISHSQIGSEQKESFLQVLRRMNRKTWACTVST